MHMRGGGGGGGGCGCDACPCVFGVVVVVELCAHVTCGWWFYCLHMWDAVYICGWWWYCVCGVLCTYEGGGGIVYVGCCVHMWVVVVLCMQVLCAYDDMCVCVCVGGGGGL